MIAGNFFPPDYKTFPFKQGDLLLSQDEGGKFSVSKVLKIDAVEVGRGEAIYMGGKDIVATEDDYLLNIGCAYGEYEFDTAEEAQAAAREGSWTVRIGHAPNRSPGAAEGQSLIGHEPVHESELEGYHLWKEAFDAGEAGVF